ncbi:MAG: hypothetical protein IKP64_12200 [Selenomonadaceae bacterium]|nr:hypothetical protein [Selenomonadaceae bacterium]
MPTPSLHEKISSSIIKLRLFADFDFDAAIKIPFGDENYLQQFCAACGNPLKIFDQLI